MSAKTKAIHSELTKHKESLLVATSQYAIHANEVARLECLRENALASLREQQKQAGHSQLRIEHLEMQVASASTWKLRFNEAESRRASLESQLRELREGVQSLIAGKAATSITTAGAAKVRHAHQDMSKDDVTAKVDPSSEPCPHDPKIATILGMGFKLARPVLIEILESVDGDLQSALSEIQNRVANNILQCQRSGEDFSASVDLLHPRDHSYEGPKPAHDTCIMGSSTILIEDEDESDGDYDFDSAREEEDTDRNNLRTFRMDMLGW